MFYNNNIDTSTIITSKENTIVSPVINNNVDINEKKINISPLINKNNIKEVLLFSLILITILLQIIVKIWTFILLMNYYNILNNIKSDKKVIYDNYKNIYYLAIANIVFTIITIIYFCYIFILYIYRYPIYKKYKTKIEILISIFWVISNILSIISYLIRNKIKDEYIKYLNDNCNIYEKLLYDILFVSFAFFCLSFIVEYSNF
jgi:hypothetical protein